MRLAHSCARDPAVRGNPAAREDGLEKLGCVRKLASEFRESPPLPYHAIMTLDLYRCGEACPCSAPAAAQPIDLDQSSTFNFYQKISLRNIRAITQGDVLIVKIEFALSSAPPWLIPVLPQRGSFFR
jgi:hypothetical protein